MGGGSSGSIFLSQVRVDTINGVERVRSTPRRKFVVNTTLKRYFVNVSRFGNAAGYEKEIRYAVGSGAAGTLAPQTEQFVVISGENVNFTFDDVDIRVDSVLVNG